MRGGARSPVLVFPGTAHLCPHQQGQLCYAALLRGRACFSECWSWQRGGAAPSPAEGCRGEVGEYFPLTPHHNTAYEEVVSAMPLSCPQNWLTHVSVYRVSSSVLPRQGAEPMLPSTEAGEGSGQVPHLLQESRGEKRRAFFPPPCHHMEDKRGAI